MAIRFPSQATIETIVSLLVVVAFFGTMALLLAGIVGGLVMTLCTGSANWLLLAMASAVLGHELIVGAG